MIWVMMMLSSLKLMSYDLLQCLKSCRFDPKDLRKMAGLPPLAVVPDACYE